MSPDPLTGKRVVVLGLALLIVGCAPLDSSSPTSASPSSRAVPSGTEPLSLPEINGTRVAADATTRRMELHTATAITATAPASRYATQTAEVAITETAASQYVATNRSIAAAITDIPDLLTEWPMPPLTDEQIEAARACDIEALYEQRYEDISFGDLPGPYPLDTACDWAALAGAYAASGSTGESGVRLPEMAHYAYAMAVSQNPAYMLKNWLVFGYLGSAVVVEASPISEHAPMRAVLNYTFGGIGYQASAEITIDHADTKSPVVTGIFMETKDTGEGLPSGTPTPRDLSVTIDSGLVRGLGASLTDLVPVDAPFDAISCTDYYPFWSIGLTYADGTQVTLNTLGNMLAGGGPWYVVIDGQGYLQVGDGIPKALDQITAALEIPGGTTAAMACFGLKDEILDLAFPDR